MDDSRNRDVKEPRATPPTQTGKLGVIRACYLNYRQAKGGAALPEDVFQRFLGNHLEWVENLYQRPHGSGLEGLSLEDIFLPPSMGLIIPPRRAEVDERLRQFPEPGVLPQVRAFLRLVEDRRRQATPLELAELLTLGDDLLVTGGPGSGKTTLLRYLAAGLARQILRNTPLPFQLSMSRRLAPVPLLAEMSGYRDYQEQSRPTPQDPHAGTLVGYLLHTLAQTSNQGEGFSARDFERILLGGGCLVMLDGLDEAVEGRERARMREQMERLANIFPSCQFLVTARENGFYDSALLTDRFTRLEMLPLNEDQVKQLVENICQKQYPHEASAHAARITAVFQEMNRLSGTDSTALISTPLLVTAAFGIDRESGQLPAERARFYNALVERILFLRQPGPDDSEQRRLLPLLAFQMQRGGPSSAALSRERLVEILQDILPGEDLQPFMVAIRERGAVIEERAGVYRFAHPAFQHILAARCLVDRRPGKEELARYAPDPWWRQTLLLTYGIAACCSNGQTDVYASELLTALSDLPAEAHLPGLELAAAATLEVTPSEPGLRPAQALKLLDGLNRIDLIAPGHVRALGGRTLAHLGDPRPEVISIEQMIFCFVPAGPFRMGSRAEDPEVDQFEQPQHDLFLSDYWIGRFAVTQAQFKVFADAGGYLDGRLWPEARSHGLWSEQGYKGWQDREPRTAPRLFKTPFDLPNHPAVGVTWYEALAYAHWLEEQARAWGRLPRGWIITLPSEAEWEKAARGGLALPAEAHMATLGTWNNSVKASAANPYPARAYPWGETFHQAYSNTARAEIGVTSAVGCLPGGSSPYGCHDMTGNVWEWMRSLWGPGSFELEWPYPYDPFKPGCEDLFAGKHIRRVLRGGSWSSSASNARCAARSRGDPVYFSDGIGFRLVVYPPSTGTVSVMRLP